MGAESIDLDLGGRRVRVVCTDPRAASVLRRAFSEHVVDEPGPLSFYVHAPDDGQRLHVVLDRSGFVLGRVRSADHAAAIAIGHLNAFLEPPAGSVRFRMRSLVGPDGGVTLAVPPLLMLPPLVERRLEAGGHRIIDRLVVPISRDGRVNTSATVGESELERIGPVPGHASEAGPSATVTRVLVPGHGTATTAQLVATIAATALPGESHDAVLDIAEAVVRATVCSVDPADASGLYDAIRGSDRAVPLRAGESTNGLG